MQDPNGLIKMPVMTVLFNTHRVGRGRHAKDYVVGLGSIFNIGGSASREFNFASSDAEADANAIANDWRAIGEDMSAVVAQYHRTRD